MSSFKQSNDQIIPLVIYQMGKVGSTVLYDTLKKHGVVYQLHSLIPARVEQTVKQLSIRGLGVPVHIKHSLDFFKKYGNTDVPIKIITPIRKALSRNMSAFFQQLSSFILIHEEVRNGLGISYAILKLAKLPVPFEWKCLLVELITKREVFGNLDFLLHYFQTRFPHRFPLDWFDWELKTALGIDVYQSPFNVKEGFQVYEKDNIKLLIFQSELSNEKKNEVLSDFVGFPVSLTGKKHSTADKIYAETYIRFKETISLKKELVDIYNNSKFMTKFYSGK